MMTVEGEGRFGAYISKEVYIIFDALPNTNQENMWLVTCMAYRPRKLDAGGASTLFQLEEYVLTNTLYLYVETKILDQQVRHGLPLRRD